MLKQYFYLQFGSNFPFTDKGKTTKKNRQTAIKVKKGRVLSFFFLTDETWKFSWLMNISLELRFFYHMSKKKKKKNPKSRTFELGKLGCTLVISQFVIQCIES